MIASYASGPEIDPHVQHILVKAAPFADSKSNIHLIAKEWVLRLAKLPLGGLLRHSAAR